MTEDDMWRDVDSARAKVAEQIAAAQERNAAASALAQEIPKLSVTTRSPRGEVAVTAKPSGQICEVVLADETEDFTAKDLSRLITDTIVDAQHAAAMAAVQATADRLGDESVFVAQLRSAAQTNFPGRGADTSELRY